VISSRFGSGPGDEIDTECERRNVEQIAEGDVLAQLCDGIQAKAA